MTTYEEDLDTSQARFDGAVEAYQAMREHVERVAAEHLLLQLRHIAQDYPYLSGVRYDVEWDSDHGEFFQRVDLAALTDHEGSVEDDDYASDAISEIMVWSGEAAAIAFEAGDRTFDTRTGRSDSGRMTRAQILTEKVPA